jgi:Na+-driven multidrug efflux pump
MMFPAAIAFAHDGVLIGAGDYRFLGRAALGYLIAVAPLGVLVLVFRDLGIAGIWAAFTVWMILRAAANHHRTNRVLSGV